MQDGTSGYGSVSYNYSIDKYDVTVGQYTDFLNAVAATDTFGLYNPQMGTVPNIEGIARGGSSGSYTYSVIGASADLPITYVSWGDAARFANWLQNGQPTGAQGAGTTETGAYTLNGAVTEAALNAITRNTGATIVIPSESEWYKAAYYDPVAGHYWNYATGTNTTPTSAPPGNTPNTANFYDNSTGYAVTHFTSHDNTQNYLTPVGAYTASASPYGVFDQSGEVLQWNESLIIGSFRGLRGGAWTVESNYLPASRRMTALRRKGTSTSDFVWHRSRSQVRQSWPSSALPGSSPGAGDGGCGRHNRTTTSSDRPPIGKDRESQRAIDPGWHESQKRPEGLGKMSCPAGLSTVRVGLGQGDWLRSARPRSGRSAQLLADPAFGFGELAVVEHVDAAWHGESKGFYGPADPVDVGDDGDSLPAREVFEA